MRIFFLPLVASVFIGCTAVPESFSPDSVPRTARTEVIVIDSPLIYSTSKEDDPDMIGGGLLPGKYVAEREDSRGIYFRGDGISQFRTGLQVIGYKRFTLFEGGIWIPKNTNEKPRPYFYFKVSYPSVSSFEDVLTQSNIHTNNTSSKINEIVRTTTLDPKLSPGQGAVAGIAVGAILSYSIARNIGNINFWPPINDVAFEGELQRQHALAAQRSDEALK